jgi:DNA-binding HxlR family transcriptional regulator
MMFGAGRGLGLGPRTIRSEPQASNHETVWRLRSSGFAGFHPRDVFKRQRVPADTPQSFADFVDFYPGHTAEWFAFNGDHHVGDVGDDFFLLLRSEDFFDDLYIDEWHVDFCFGSCCREFAPDEVVTLARLVIALHNTECSNPARSDQGRTLMRRIRYGQLCPIAKAAEVLGERWTILIIRELLVGNHRYSGLQRALSRLSPTLLTRRLKQLQECGLVVRQSASTGARAEYRLSPAGRDLERAVFALGEWGMRWARGQMRPDEIDVQMLMVDLSRRLDAARLPAGRTVLEFDLAGLRKFRRWWIVIEANGTRELCSNHPGHATDLTLRLDPCTLGEIWTQDLTIPAALKNGRLSVTGDPALARSLSVWLRPGALAHIRPVRPQLSI